MTILSRIGQAAVSGTLGVYNIGEGVTKAAVGTTAAVAGTVVDPGLRFFGGLGTGAIDELQQQTGYELVGQERLAAMREAAKSQGFTDNELVNMGKDTAISGGLDLFQAREDVIRAGKTLAGDDEAAEAALERKQAIGNAQDEMYNPVTFVADIATGKVLPRAVGAIFGAAQLAENASDQGESEISDAERRERIRQIEEEREKREAAEREADLANIRANMEDAEQLSTLSKEEAESLFRVLAGPDGWEKFGENRSSELFNALQSGNYGLIQRSYTEWRSKGGTWRND